MLNVQLEAKGLNKMGNVRITLHRDAFAQLLLQWESNQNYTTLVCVFVALGT
jgi:hypothetical protein